MRKFENKISYSLTDMNHYYSDMKFSDGYYSGRARLSTVEESNSLSHRNHTFNNEHYYSGYETTMDMPKV